MSDETTIVRCPVCHRRTWITNRGTIHAHHDSGMRHYCPMSGRIYSDVTAELVDAIARHPANTPIPS